MMATLAADIVSNCCQDAPETKRYATLLVSFIAVEVSPRCSCNFHVRLYQQQGRPNTPRLAVCLSRDDRSHP